MGASSGRTDHVVGEGLHTLRLMIRLYCRKKHGCRIELCPDCQTILDYAAERLRKCPLLPDKPGCRQCPVHCYQPEMRRKIAEIMRFAGPRMLVYHPIELVKYRMREKRKARMKK